MTKGLISSLAVALKRHKEGAIIMVELPADSYFESSSDSVKLLTSKGFGGIYISFQRPFKNIASLLKQKGTNLDKLIFIDAATSIGSIGGKSQQSGPRCIHISPDIDVDELVRAIYTSLPKLKSKKKFVFLDSLTTIALYKPLSEILRFSEFLVRMVKKQEVESVIFNVAKDLAQKKFIRDIGMHADEVIIISK